MPPNSEDADEARPLLEATVRRFVSPHADIVRHETRRRPVQASTSDVVHHELLVRTNAHEPPRTVGLVTKRAPLAERRVLRLLGEVVPDLVPFSHTFDLSTNDVAWTCMEDLGSVTRPNSLAPIDLAVFDSEARGLARIHAAFLDRTNDLDWLPTIDRAYFERCIHEWFWRPAWERALSNDDFRAEFASAIPVVEHAAATIVDEMAALNAEEGARTLTHTDLHPSNELLRDGEVHFIDWGAAHVGTLYLDIPHLFHTPELAARYRGALERRDVLVSPSDFEERYRVAARYTALRYMWWTLDEWLSDRSASVWVRHYLDRLTS
ncbi:phosphotransferase [Deinococcus yavapaiensis]|uniref:Aminoglycoside phosphotransferase (APT) family kinase protein n=1 Tax=Deinococcus yavapaiensis KR-236 TaxID=694435 RepID=A0A318SIH3_9DEIO|nr:phosphotransferase [Deinococcus yavapaiensis]PYE51172.1 aminoglycoside phosphotransferase (APT) family kinase protein [Deinococcus yavapaiensis KR-236]